MSIFKDIVNKLLHKGQAASSQAATPTTDSSSTANAKASPTTAAPTSTAPPAAAAPTAGSGGGQQPLSQVDVQAVMDKAASEAGQTLNWRTSIVDTLKALGVDSSLDNRKALAKELHYDGDMNDSAAMNTWLHKRVMQELAVNGGKLPKDLTD